MPKSKALLSVSEYPNELEKSKRKASGAHYTPAILADFVAGKLAKAWKPTKKTKTVRALDPACGDGELLHSLGKQLTKKKPSILIHGFDTDSDALHLAKWRLEELKGVQFELHNEDFLDFALEHYVSRQRELTSRPPADPYDLLIANPPYVRTQVMGAERAQEIAKQFNLSGRVDLYHAFLESSSHALYPGGLASIICSNRFMTTRSGTAIRKSIAENFDILHIWDLGDTKIFEAAVLPAVLLLKKKSPLALGVPAGFSSIYTTSSKAEHEKRNAIEALKHNGVVAVNGHKYLVQHGTLDYGKDPQNVWRIATASSDSWLSTTAKNTFCTFGEIGKIRVGVKSTADKIFLRNDWNKLPVGERPEILKPALTSWIGERFKVDRPADAPEILYTHEVVDGKRRPIRLDNYPRARRYLERHRADLEGRTYVIEAGRQWYELWVPQNPSLWEKPKVVFPDISEKPCFWMDLEGSVVNGDCYWFTSEKENLLWLALGVGNSAFIEDFYDHKFHNKLYAGRRRFMTQYVQEFPVPDPEGMHGREIIELTKRIYAANRYERVPLESELNKVVLSAFGLA